jgi:hypothetical protein
VAGVAAPPVSDHGSGGGTPRPVYRVGGKYVYADGAPAPVPTGAPMETDEGPIPGPIFMDEPLHPETPHLTVLLAAGLVTNGDFYELGWEGLFVQVPDLSRAAAQEIYDWSAARDRERARRRR